MMALGKELDIPVVDLWTLCQGDDASAYPSYLVDGLHLNSR